MPRRGGSASSDGRRLSSALAHSSCSRVRHARFRDSMCSTLRAHLLHGETEVCTRAANRRVCSRALRASCPPLVCGGSRAFGVPPARPLSVVCLSVGLGVRSSRVCIRPCVWVRLPCCLHRERNTMLPCFHGKGYFTPETAPSWKEKIHHPLSIFHHGCPSSFSSSRVV